MADEMKIEALTLPQLAREYRSLVRTAKNAAETETEKAQVQPWEQHADLLDQHLEEQEKGGTLDRWLTSEQGGHHLVAAQRRYGKAKEALKTLTNRAARAKAEK